MADGGRALPPAASRICSRSTTRKLPPRRDASASVTLSQSIRTADVVCNVFGRLSRIESHIKDSSAMRLTCPVGHNGLSFILGETRDVHRSSRDVHRG